MSRFRRPQGLTIWPKLFARLLAMLLALLWTARCARPAGSPGDDAVVHADQHQVPFHDDAESGASPSQGSPTAQDAGSNPETGLPFHNLQNHDPTNLPAGTLLTVRLKTPISAENPGANGTFEAVVDEPVVIEGNRLVPRGVVVAGRVESARASNVKRNRGYVRLVLNSIRLASVSLPIQTSSLFVRGNAGVVQVGEATKSEASTVVIHLEKGRRLTFRLTEPAYVAASQRTSVDH